MLTTGQAERESCRGISDEGARQPRPVQDTDSTRLFRTCVRRGFRRGTRRARLSDTRQLQRERARSPREPDPAAAAGCQGPGQPQRCPHPGHHVRPPQTRSHPRRDTALLTPRSAPGDASQRQKPGEFSSRWGRDVAEPPGSGAPRYLADVTQHPAPRSSPATPDGLVLVGFSQQGSREERAPPAQGSEQPPRPTPAALRPSWNWNPHLGEHVGHRTGRCLLAVSPPPLLRKDAPRHEARTNAPLTLRPRLVPFPDAAPTVLPSAPPPRGPPSLAGASLAAQSQRISCHLLLDAAGEFRGTGWRCPRSSPCGGRARPAPGGQSGAGNALGKGRQETFGWCLWVAA